MRQGLPGRGDGLSSSRRRAASERIDEVPPGREFCRRRRARWGVVALRTIPEVIAVKPLVRAPSTP